jgi:hypothetical protein
LTDPEDAVSTVRTVSLSAYEEAYSIGPRCACAAYSREGTGLRGRERGEGEEDGRKEEQEGIEREVEGGR